MGETTNNQTVSKTAQAQAFQNMRARAEEIKKRRGTPGAAEAAAAENVDRMYQTGADGADPTTGTTVHDDAGDEQLTHTAETSTDPEAIRRATEELNRRQQAEARKMQTAAERAPATKRTVDENIEHLSYDQESWLEFIRRMVAGQNRRESESVKKAKSQAAQSRKTDIPPETEKILYGKDSCTSQGQPVKYTTAFTKVDWGQAIKANSRSIEESVEYLTSYLTNAVRDNYGGWGRITEIIVRDQKLIINRTCFTPILDSDTIKADMFPIDTLDYLREGAIGAFFDWSMLKHMRNLTVLDVDDLGFYEYNIGGRLKCGRRIGVSSIFNLCPGLEVLILGGDEVRREDLGNEKSTPVKQKLATHKRFSLFSDGYKLNVCQNTSAFSGWTFNNMKNYATNRGNKGIIRFSAGLIARAGMAGAAGVLNLGTHLVGGIWNTIKEATTPVNPSDVGLQ